MRIFSYLGQHRLAVVAVLALLLVQAVCELSVPALTADLVDVGIAEGLQSGAGVDMGYLLRTGGLMLALTLATGVLSVVVSYVSSTTSGKIGRDLRGRLFARVLSFTDAEVQRFTAASLITRCTNDVQQIQLTCSMLLRMILYAPMMAVGGIVMVVRTDTQMAWVILVAVAAVAAVMLVLMVVALPKFRLMQKLIDKMNEISREILTGLPVIRAFNRQDLERGRFDAANGELLATQLFTNRTMAFMQPAMMLIMNGVSVLIVWTAAGFIDAGTMETGDMIAFITYSMTIIMSFLMLSSVAILLPRADVSAARIEEVLACEPAVVDPASPRTLEEGSAAGARIEFRDVSFCYGDASEPALEHVSFAVEPGQTVALVGATGSGKTTVLKLLLRFHDATEGAVLVDGVDVRDLAQRDLHAQFGYVPQQAFLFSGTVRSNIAYADAGMDEARIRHAADVAQASGFIAEKEGGLDAAVSQGGTNVSGGQRQRLAIARALAADARALLFDDSFSALDYATDAALRTALKREHADRTVLIVAQRIGTVRDADRIVVLDEGRVVGTGTHAQLLATCPVYREIARSQVAPEELEGGAA